MQKSTSGLRDRQRAQTLRDLHEAAVTLARDGGLAAATVEAIAERANVSRRTFFNYFPTKEDALLGTTSPEVPRVALERFLERSTDDAFGEAIRFVVAIVHSTFGVELPLEERRELLIDFPSLRARLAQHISTAEGLVAAALDERAVVQGASAARNADSSRALLMLAGTVLRFAYTKDPDAVAGDGTDAIESAISVFRTIFEEIQ